MYIGAKIWLLSKGFQILTHYFQSSAVDAFANIALRITTEGRPYLAAWVTSGYHRIDDTSAIGKISDLCEWWESMCTLGPRYGYFPKASKS